MKPICTIYFDQNIWDLYLKGILNESFKNFIPDYQTIIVYSIATLKEIHRIKDEK